MPGLVNEEAPREQAQGIGPVHGEEPPPVVGDLAQLARLDELFGVEHEGGEAVVVAHAGDHPGPAAGVLDAGGLLGGAPHRLLAEDVLAGRGGRGHQRLVQHVGGADDHCVGVGMFDCLTPVVGGLSEPEGAGGGVAAGLDGVGADHHFGVVDPVAVVKQRRQPQVGAGMGLAHPAEAHHGQPDAPPGCHGVALSDVGRAR